MPAPRSRPPFVVALLLPLLLGAGRATATEPAARSTVDDQDAVSIRGIFDFQLPKIIRPESLRFTLNPSLGDLTQKDYVRVRTGLRYALTRHCELSAEVLPYIDNFGGKGEGGAGLAEYRFGGKLAWNNLLRRYFDTALGATVTMPAPGAPDQLTIGTTRCNPYIALSRELHAVPGLGAFLNVGYEFFDSDPAPGRIARYRPSRDNLIVTPGVVLHRAPWHYTFATPCRTTGIDGEGREYLSLQPSVSYEVPSRWLPRLPGRLVVGAGYEAIFFGSEVEHRFTSRVRWDVDWRKAAHALGDNVLDSLPWRNGERGPKD